MSAEGLLGRVEATGHYMKRKLPVALDGKNGIVGIRGQGTSFYIDTTDEETAKKLQNHLASNGVLVGTEGRHVTTKPALTLDEDRAKVMVDALYQWN